MFYIIFPLLIFLPDSIQLIYLSLLTVFFILRRLARGLL